jgi:hypothetical protein
MTLGDEKMALDIMDYAVQGFVLVLLPFQVFSLITLLQYWKQIHNDLRFIITYHHG